MRMANVKLSLACCYPASEIFSTLSSGGQARGG